MSRTTNYQKADQLATIRVTKFRIVVSGDRTVVRPHRAPPRRTKARDVSSCPVTAVAPTALGPRRHLRMPSALLRRLFARAARAISPRLGLLVVPPPGRRQRLAVALDERLHLSEALRASVILGNPRRHADAVLDHLAVTEGDKPLGEAEHSL
jgi:hypothetical protein